MFLKTPLFLSLFAALLLACSEGANAQEHYCGPRAVRWALFSFGEEMQLQDVCDEMGVDLETPVRA